MKKYFLYVLGCCALTITGIAQKGPYFQQQVDYKIKVSLDDREHILHAVEDLIYTNNSPDTLRYLYFHLWPNAYSDNSTAFARQQLRLKKDNFFFDDRNNYGFMDGIHFITGKDTLYFSFELPDIDICKVKLMKPLAPGKTVQMSIPFRVFIPKTYSRLGHVGQAYQITQWYPKPAVYDREGWHPMPYLDEGEFYSEFGSFEVDITVPENYVVAATGVLQNQNEKKWLIDRTSKTIDLSDTIRSSEVFKTLTYKQDKIHDFAWFADKSYNVAYDSVTLESGKVVDVWYYYSSYWSDSKVKSIQDLKDAVYCYSKWVGEYPYASATAVTGALGAGAGMEYPMITVTDPMAIIHEVGHNWFYGILGSNERDYGWMDEGLNSFIENEVYKFQAERNKKKKEQEDLTDLGFEGDTKAKLNARQRELSLAASGAGMPYAAMRTRAFAQPVQLHSNLYYEFNYGMSLYMNPPLFLKFLRNYVGEETFNQCFLQYYQDWKFKHPQPEDMQESFERTCGKDLSWFFNGLIKTTERVDIGIKSLKKVGETYVLTLKNVGSVAIPVNVKVYDRNGQVLKEQWIEPFNGESQMDVPFSDFKNIRINEVDYDLDLSPNNNYIARRGIKKIKSLKLKLLTGVDSSHKCEEYVMPFLGYNMTDGVMPGLAFYNTAAVSKRLEYLIAPMFSFKSGEIQGLAGLNLKWNGKKTLTRNNLQTSIQKFSSWKKVDFIFNHFSKQQFIGMDFNRNIRFTNFYSPYSIDSVTTGATYGNKLEYTLYKTDAVNQFFFTGGLEFLGTSFTPWWSGSSAIGLYKQGSVRYQTEISYARKYWKKSWAKIRLFAGSQSYQGSYFDYGMSGKQDYGYEYFAFDRTGSTNLGSRQTNEGDAGFRQGLGLTSRALVAVNFTSDIPKVPFKVFADWALVNGGNTHYDAGLSLKLVNGFLGIHFPLVGSGYSNGAPSSFRDFTDQIRFTLKWKVQPIEQSVRRQVL